MVKNALRRKLFRDMWKNRMQFLAVILLCALGTWVFSGLDAAWRMIDLSASTYFESQNLADLWVTLQGMDRAVLAEVRAMPGVKDVQARASAELKVDLPHESSLVLEAYDESIRINRPLMYEGAALESSDMRGCLLDKEFAAANGLVVGDRLPIKLGESVYEFIIRGTCLSAEYVSLNKNTVHDPLNYGFVIINSRGMERLALNGMVITLEPGAGSDAVRDRISARYPEALIVDHTSHKATHGLRKDVEMFRNLSYVFPLLAFAVAAMIVLTTITRMLENQRTQMGTLKALGYHDGQMLRHYLSYAFYPSLVGSLVGLFVGRCTLPYILWSLEEAQFTFPYRLQAPISAAQWAVCAVGVTLSCLICLRTYRKSAREQTAALLRPKPPRAGRKLMLERIPAVWSRLGFNSKMVVRNLFRNKARTLMSLIGVLCCTMLIITSLGLQDSVVYFVGKYYRGTVQYTLRAGLTSGAGEVEGYRKRIPAETLEGAMDKSVSVRGNGNARTTLLTVLEDGQTLMHLGENERWVPMPAQGVMLSQKLAEALEVRVGDSVELWLPGDKEPIATRVSGIAYITMGQTAFMSRSMWDAQKKGSFTPTALLLKNPTQEGLQRLNDLEELDELRDPEDEYVDTLKILDSLTNIFMLMSAAALGLAFVVLYNMGILNFMERMREYATLKVLGYHQKEIRGLMTAENNLITILGLLLGIAPGWWLTGTVLRSCESDSMVFASTVKPVSIIIACVVTYAFSWLITRLLTRKVKTIDMVEALKSVE